MDVVAHADSPVKRRPGHPLLLRFLVWICLPLLVGSLFGFWHLRGSLPPATAEVAVRGVEGRLSIHRDSHGVPHITASSDRDAYFAMGYMHAQDRLWQLELQRRLAQGRLSEVLGREALDSDIWMRTLNLYASAESAWRVSSPEAKAALQAYAAGVNAYLQEGHVLPLEFLLLGVEPQPWRAIDSLAWFKVFSLSQSNSMRQEANRYVFRRYLREAQWRPLEVEYPPDGPVTAVTLPTMQGIAQMSVTLEKRWGLGGLYVGSNAWVLSGALTKDGAPILANDPHLTLQMPSLWYVASLSAPGFSASGMSVVGLPNIIFGRNANIAWGGTNMLADTQDLYILETDPGQPNQYRVNGEWRSMEVHQEEIHIRNEFPAALRKPLEPVRVQVRHSQFGPVVSDVVGTLDQPVSLRWTGLAENDTSYEAILRLAYAKDWQEFNRAAAYLIAPAINLLYIDDSNNIGFVAAGQVPIRGHGDGSLPVPAADPRYEWAGHIPFEQMPRSYNPERGYLVNANNSIVSDGYPHFISRDWGPPARAQRIIALIQQTLKARGKIAVEDVQRMQADVQDLEAVALKEYLVRLLGDRSPAGAPLAMLRQWNGEMGRDQIPAGIFNLWLNRLRRHLILDDLEGFQNSAAQARALRDYVDFVTPVQLKQMMIDGNYDWCDDRTTSVKESCTDIAVASLADALAELRKRHGKQSDWQWGKLHRTVLKHVPFSNVNGLDLLFERRISSPGSDSSIDVSFSRYTESEGFEQEFGATFRQVIAMAPGKVRHSYMNSTGQSGNPLSEHFDDMVAPFSRVEFFELNAASTTQHESLLTLVPAHQTAAKGR